MKRKKLSFSLESFPLDVILNLVVDITDNLEEDSDNNTEEIDQDDDE